MTGTVAQQLSLISYGNQFLQQDTVPTGYYPANPAFTFCNAVDFLHVQGRSTVPAAPNPEAWFELLRQRGCRHLWLCYQQPSPNELNTPAHMLAGFVGGGGSWLLEADYGTAADYWAERWQVTQEHDPDRRIWHVSYGRVSYQQPPTRQQPAVALATTELRQALVGIADFAASQQLSNWVEVFQKAVRILDGHEATPSFYDKLLATGRHSPTAVQLIFAASQAWVFGGMGSWNDLGFAEDADNQRYAALSAALYDKVVQALVSGINS